MKGALTQLEREVARILPQIRRLELISVDSAAKLLKQSPRWVRANLPLIVTSPRSQRVRLADVEAFLMRRTVSPKITHADLDTTGEKIPFFKRRRAA